MAGDLHAAETDFVEGLCDDADAAPRATGGAETRSVRRSTMASIEENYLRLPTMGQGSISGKTAWKSMSTAARLSQVRFGGINQFVTGASSVGYGVMRDIFKPQDDSELEAFGCIECLQPADKVPYLGG